MKEHREIGFYSKAFADPRGGAYLGGDRYQEAAKATPGLKMAFGKAFNPKGQVPGMPFGKLQRRRQSLDASPALPGNSNAPETGETRLYRIQTQL